MKHVAYVVQRSGLSNLQSDDTTIKDAVLDTKGDMCVFTGNRFPVIDTFIFASR